MRSSAMPSCRHGHDIFPIGLLNTSHDHVRDGNFTLVKIAQTPPICAERSAHLLHMAGDVNKTTTVTTREFFVFFFICQNFHFALT